MLAIALACPCSDFARVKACVRLWLAALIAAFLMAGTAQATDDTHTSVDGVSEGPRIALAQCLTTLRPKDTARALLATPSRFDCQTPQGALAPGDYWLRLTPPHGRMVTGAMNMLSFLPTWQVDAHLYAELADGRLIDQPLDNHTLSEFTRVGGRITVPLDNDGVPVRKVLLRIVGSTKPINLLDEPQLLTIDQVNDTEMLETAIYAGFGGLCLALLICNLAMLLPVRSRFQITYCLMLVCMLAFAMVYSGIPSVMMPDLDIAWRFRLVYATLGLSGVLALRFFVDFLEPEILTADLRRISKVQTLALLASSMIATVAPISATHLCDTIFTWTFVPLPLVVTAIIISTTLRGSPSARLMLVAWLAPVFFAGCRLMFSLGFTRFGMLAYYAPLAAMCVESLLSALAVAIKVRRIVEERDAARAKERFARQLAEIDPLTGLLNRRALLDRIVAAADGEPMRLMLVDIDHFKQINDTHGHDVGDRVLCDVAAVLAEQAGAHARIARLGGEEFALLGNASELSPAQALAILVRMRSHVFGQDIRLTVSIGIAHGPLTNEAQWAALYRKADVALYEAKSAGRNRAVDETGISTPAPGRQLPLALPPAGVA